MVHPYFTDAVDGDFLNQPLTFDQKLFLDLFFQSNPKMINDSISANVDFEYSALSAPNIISIRLSIPVPMVSISILLSVVRNFRTCHFFRQVAFLIFNVRLPCCFIYRHDKLVT